MAQNTSNAAAFSGSDASAKINTCIANVIKAGGGVCDASSFGGVQKMSQEIELGSPTSPGQVGVTLILPNNATWIWHLTDGVSCGIRQYSGTTLLGRQPGGGGNRMGLTASAGSNMDAIYCTDANSSGDYVRAEGFSAYNNESATMVNGVVHVQNVADESTFSRIYAENYYGDAFHIDSACCGAKFDGIQGVSNGNISNGATGGVPLTIGPGKVRSVSISNSTFNQPGPGFSDIAINGNAIMGVSFYSVYMEGNGAVDATTPMVYLGGSVGPVYFFSGLANTEQPALAGTKPVFENHGYKLSVNGFEAINTSYGINDFTSGHKVPVVNYWEYLGSIAPYTTTK